MKHRHNGKYKSRTPKGHTTFKRRPIHSQTDKYKNWNYNRLRRKFKIHPLADDDKDKVPNYKDCRPWNKKKQDVEDKFRMERDISRLQEGIDELGEPQWKFNKTKIQLENALHLLRMRLKSEYDIDPQTMDESQIAKRLSWVKKPAWEREPEKYPGLFEDTKRLREEGYYGDEVAEDISEAVEGYNQLQEELHQVTEEISDRADKITQKKEAIDETEQLIKEGIWK